MDPDRPDEDLPELDADAVVAPPDGPAVAADGSVVDDHGPELDIDHIEASAAEELVLELDDAPAPVIPAPAAGAVDEPEVVEQQSLLAQARDSLRADSGRLLRTGLKAAAWLGIGSLVLGHPGLLAGIVGAALAGDVVIWFVIRALELPKHLWAFQFEALINIGAVWLMLDVMHLFDSFRDPEILPFGLVTFLLVGLGRFMAYWFPRVLNT